MLTSLIVRSFNQKRFLAKALESALAQDADPATYEIVAVDDGSTDGSRAILAGYADRIRLVLIEGPRRGAVPALNAGLSAARGDAFTLLDADDWAEPGLLRELVRPLDDPAVGFSYCDYFEELPDGSARKTISLAQNPFQGIAAGFLYRLAPVAAAGFYDETLMFPEYDLLARMLRDQGGAHVPRPLYHYVRHGGNLTADPVRARAEIAKVVARHGITLPVREYGTLEAPTPFLRPARPGAEDAQLLFDWRNDPVTRAASLNTVPLAWDAHLAWYGQRLASPDCRILMAEEEGLPVGMVRLERRGGNAWEVSIALAPDKRFGGRGTRLLLLAEAHLKTSDPNARFEAKIRPENTASQKMFRKAGYTLDATLLVDGVPVQRWLK